jgi:hypothetical protein
VMCLVIYAWAVQQDYFREMTDQSIREELYEKDKSQLEEDMSPFGFIEDGANENIIVADDQVWKVEYESERYDRYRDKIDEYGMPSSDWHWGGQGYW